MRMAFLTCALKRSKSKRALSVNGSVTYDYMLIAMRQQLS